MKIFEAGMLPGFGFARSMDIIKFLMVATDTILIYRNRRLDRLRAEGKTV